MQCTICGIHDIVVRNYSECSMSGNLFFCIHAFVQVKMISFSLYFPIIYNKCILVTIMLLCQILVNYDHFGIHFIRCHFSNKFNTCNDTPMNSFVLNIEHSLQLLFLFHVHIIRSALIILVCITHAIHSMLE